MSASQEPENIYCLPQDVADLLNLTFDEESKPSSDQVQKLINNKQDLIDRKTKHAWREVKVTDELHDLEGAFQYGHGYDVDLHHRVIRTFDSAQGDKVQYWNGSDWQDLLTGITLNSGIVVHYDRGIISFKSYSLSWIMHRRFRVTYRYGEIVVPKSIREICAKMVAIEIANGALFWRVLPMGGDRKAIDETIREWREDIKDALADYEEVVAIY